MRGWMWQCNAGLLFNTHPAHTQLDRHTVQPSLDLPRREACLAVPTTLPSASTSGTCWLKVRDPEGSVWLCVL
jgi:hypothetical protein